MHNNKIKKIIAGGLLSVAVGLYNVPVSEAALSQEEVSTIISCIRLNIITPQQLADKYKSQSDRNELIQLLKNTAGINASSYIEALSGISAPGEAEYRKGMELKKQGNPIEAYFEFSSAADMGHPKAAWELCWMYYEGIGTGKDHVKARQYLKQSAEGGYTAAYKPYAEMLLDCEGLLEYPNSRDRARALYVNEAMRYLKAGADAGDPDAMIYLGYIYLGKMGFRYNEYSTDVELITNVDIHKGLEYLFKAKNTGTALGYYEYGRIFYDGKFVPKNYAEAERYLRKAYEMGARSNQYDENNNHTGIRYMLSYMYRNGGYGLQPQPDNYDHNHPLNLFI